MHISTDYIVWLYAVYVTYASSFIRCGILIATSSYISFIVLQFLQKMVSDRAENVAAVQRIAAQISDQTDAKEQLQVGEEIEHMTARWQSLNSKVSDRSKSLDDNLGRCQSLLCYHGAYLMSMDWLID